MAFPTASSRFNEWGGKIALFFSYTHFSQDLTTGLLVALLPFIREDLGLNYLQTGFLVSAYSLTAGFSQLLGGWLSDRVDRQKTIALGMGGVGLTAVAISLAPSYIAILVAMLAMGVLSGFYHPAAVPMLTDRFEKQRRGRVIAIHMVGGSLGFALGPLLAAAIASRWSWHVAYAVLSLPALLGFVLVYKVIKLPPVARQSIAPSPLEKGQKPVTVWGVFRRAAAVIALSVPLQLLTGPVAAFTPLFLVDVRHVPLAVASMWVTIIRAGGVLGGLFGGWLSDRWGRRNTIYLTLALFGPAVFLVARLPYGFFLGVAMVFFGFLMTMREATVQTYLMDAAPPRLRATVFGIYFGFGQQGSSVIQPVAGNLMDALGIVGVFNAMSFISLGFSVLAVGAAVRKVRRGRQLKLGTP